MLHSIPCLVSPGINHLPIVVEVGAQVPHAPVNLDSRFLPDLKAPAIFVIISCRSQDDASRSSGESSGGPGGPLRGFHGFDWSSADREGSASGGKWCASSISEGTVSRSRSSDRAWSAGNGRPQGCAGPVVTQVMNAPLPTSKVCECAVHLDEDFLGRSWRSSESRRSGSSL